MFVETLCQKPHVLRVLTKGFYLSYAYF